MIPSDLNIGAKQALIHHYLFMYYFILQPLYLDANYTFAVIMARIFK